MQLIPKIKIEVSFDELCEVCDTFSTIPNLPFNKREILAFYSVINSIVEKLLKKQLAKRHTAKFNLSLEFFEAHWLEYWLVNFCNVQPTSNAQRFIDKLNQKLT